VTSFSCRMSSSGAYSGMSGRIISTLRRWVAPEDMPKKSSCPSTFCRRLAPMESRSLSWTAISWLRLAPKPSKAPARIRFSTARLLMSLSYIRSQKSWKPVKSPPRSRSRTTAWIKPRPMFLMATRPKRMPSGSTVKLSRDRFTSGGSRAMPMSRHSLMYSDTFSAESSTDVSSAAMYSRGWWSLNHAVW